MDRIEKLLDELCVEQAAMPLARERGLETAFGIARIRRDALLRQIADEWGEMVEALGPFAYLAQVMEEGNILNFRGVYITQEQAQAADDILSRAKGES